MRNFILKLILVALIVSIVPICNYVGDPSHVYDNGDYEKSIVDILITGKNATNVDANLNERLLMRLLAQKYSKNIDNLILGPSRTMLLSEKVLHNGKLLNLSLSGATLEDMIAMYYICKLSGINTKELIICIDPQLFNENNMDKRWKYNASYYDGLINEAFKTRKHSLMVNSMKIENLFSVSYFQSSIKTIFRKIIDHKTNDNIGIVATDNYDNTGRTLHYDGSVSYDDKFRNTELKDVNISATTWSYAQFDSYNSLSKKSIEELQAFMDYVRKDHVEIKFFCAPFHPITYQRFMSEKNFKCVRSAMEYITQFSALNKIKVIGSYNPVDCGCDETCFYDGVHLNEKGIEIVFRNEHINPPQNNDAN